MARLRLPSLLLLPALLLTARARADVIVLTNGRKLEGRVVRRTPKQVTLTLPSGRLVLPRSLIRSIRTCMTPEQELGVRAARTDMNDPAAIDRLALWASERGLGAPAMHLRALARGIRLERKVAAARADGRARAFVDVYHWSRSAGVAEEVQRWLLDQACAINREDPVVQEAVALLQADVDLRLAREAHLAEVARWPSYVMPKHEDDEGGDASGGVVAAPSAPSGPRHDAEAAARALRVAALLRRLQAVGTHPRAAHAPASHPRGKLSITLARSPSHAKPALPAEKAPAPHAKR